ncbi:recombinase family protein [Brevundimonas diminuta]|uniref:recombinase family protein n=1 Tax=Brevundimonas diminuta TaxID=293 RepID=UPI003F819B78
MSPPRIRCAIYTRKSTEEGLDQAFNSLDAQREACEAYIKSQAAEGWVLVPTAYDDGGFSGGNMDRPALLRLLAQVDAGLIDTIVVYKIDRLTRALSDFARIVERLDRRGASFVSVTQAFNTTTSMGRLTLNVLLSFAQFEREVTGERIRDKIAASKKKGMWMGGVPPLGYDLPTDPMSRALVVNEAEAEQVRALYRLYLELGSVAALAQHLQAEGWLTRMRISRKGNRSGGVPYSRGALFHLLKNRIYLGEIVHGDAAMPGRHPAIIDTDLFEAVQQRLKANVVTHRDRPLRSADLPLKGLVHDADGHRMSPSFGYGRGGKVYRYYVSAPLQQGGKLDRRDGVLRRVRAEALHEVVEAALVSHQGHGGDLPLAALLAPVTRVDLLAEEVRITFRADRLLPAARKGLETVTGDAAALALAIPVRCQARGGRVEQVGFDGRPLVHRHRRDPVLIKGLRRAHQLARGLGWNASDGALRQVDVAAPAGAYDRKLVRLAFLAPDLQRAILEGRQAPGLTLSRLLDEPISPDWDRQRRMFGAAA